jgi:hypothetical protein
MMKRIAASCLLFVFASALSGCQTAGTADGGFVPLYDGETLDGWHVTGGNATFRVEDGDIVGTCENSRPNTFLRTDRDDYEDFELRGQFKWDIPGNSGVQFRSQQKPQDAERGAGVVYGYQFEIDPSDRAWTAGVQEESRRGWLVPLKGEANKAKRDAVELDGWNDFVIRCEGDRIQTWLNGVPIADYTDTAENRLKQGFFALQIHWGESSQVRWRGLRVKELD